MRLELAPLGVRVITGMLGKIESKFHDNDAWEGLPESSPYKGVENQIRLTACGAVGPKCEKLDEFAARFVDDITGGASGQVWRGAMAQTTRFMAYHAPTSLLVRVLHQSRCRSTDGMRRIECFYQTAAWISWRNRRPRTRPSIRLLVNLKGPNRGLNGKNVSSTISLQASQRSGPTMASALLYTRSRGSSLATDLAPTDSCSLRFEQPKPYICSMRAAITLHSARSRSVL
jgi:hypothetical protein